MGNEQLCCEVSHDPTSDSALNLPNEKMAVNLKRGEVLDKIAQLEDKNALLEG